jgi:predicted SnoaL-like aldol condensation-catalyzing enzyme
MTTVRDLERHVQRSARATLRHLDGLARADADSAAHAVFALLLELQPRLGVEFWVRVVEDGELVPMHR